VFVGREAEFRSYQQLQRQLDAQQQEAAAMNENAAQEEQFNWMIWPQSIVSRKYLYMQNLPAFVILARGCRAKRPYWESSARVAHRVHRLWD
jgi:hypothetical protein